MAEAPLGVIRSWFAAHADGDITAARALMAPSCRIVIGRDEIVGFDAFMAWYRRRSAAEGPTFRYEVMDVLGGDRYGAAVLRLCRDDETWTQVVVYEVRDGVIATVSAYEDR